ncbi:MAG: acyl-ACP--UDP-N-acetylglucosamine O-acyltransferase [Victivallaceae bacterium]
MPKIHPTSVVAAGAILADDVEIGPLCYVGPHVKLGPGCRLIAQCNIDGYTTIGAGNVFFPFSAIGHCAQDHSVVPDAPTYLEIGDGNMFRENVTVHTGAKPETKTVVGSGGMFMGCTHIAHNCVVGNHVIMVNSAGLAGHCEVGDRALISGLSGLHQFCRVGRLAIISGGSVFSKDIPPFMMAEGRNGGVKMINLIGLKRAGFAEETITVIKHMHRLYYRSGLAPSNALKAIREELPQIPEVLEFLTFCETSKKGVLPARLEGKR